MKHAAKGYLAICNADVHSIITNMLHLLERAWCIISDGICLPICFYFPFCQGQIIGNISALQIQG
jgi:hypothetical protein